MELFEEKDLYQQKKERKGISDHAMESWMSFGQYHISYYTVSLYTFACFQYFVFYLEKISKVQIEYLFFVFN